MSIEHGYIDTSMHWFSLNKVCGGLNCTSVSICASFKSRRGTCLSSMAKLILSMHWFSVYKVCGGLNCTSISIHAISKVGVTHFYRAWLSWYFDCIDFLFIRCVEGWITLVFRFMLVLKVGVAHVYWACWEVCRLWQ